MFEFKCDSDNRVQKTLDTYEINKFSRLCGCNVIGYKVRCDDNFCIYNPPNNGPAKIFISRNIIESYPQEEFDWVVLHECCPLYYGHILDSGGFTIKENELCADYWACEKQGITRYGIAALNLLCNRDTSKISHTKIVRNLNRWNNFQKEGDDRSGVNVNEFTFGVRITALKNCDLPYEDFE